MYKPPQWHQNANRGSQLADPVVTIQELSRFRALRNTRIDYALVFTNSQGNLDTYLPPHRPSRTELATRGWSTVYEVDTGVHDASALLSLPSDNDAFLFDVSLECTWQVTAPAAFVASGERDVPALIRRIVDDTVRPVLRQYPMLSSAAAEKAAQSTLEGIGPFGESAGLRIRCGIQIRQDEAAQQHARELREIEFARIKLAPEHTLRMQTAELEAERALATSRLLHRVELQNQELSHERQLARGQQELQLQEVEIKKIEYYTYWLERGGPAAMGFHLARHPEDAQLVMNNLRQDQLQAMQNQLQVALQALGGGPGGLEEHQLDEPRRLAAGVIREVLSAKLAPGNSHTVHEVAPLPGGADLPGSVPPPHAAPPSAVPDPPAAPQAGPGPQRTEPFEDAHLFGYRVPNPPPAR
ncbi:PE-PGRS family protein [Kitasatospora sp. YST-16]|uniref:PE-PGRS family protein n=1 Tax=Kitasatospora sp. YST-16 TaxID=2998080 RepID=UPI0022850C8D|nr:PE-PGRS family protein [Kitasatospora sp. YST-16]WAL72557.1 PE-PGRS family protein [Kitasatospora sp. YST-16]WNW38604.1 PE-PGRS family protein [Streptomyces sp. Li-HN-5-13]